MNILQNGSNEYKVILSFYLVDAQFPRRKFDHGYAYAI